MIKEDDQLNINNEEIARSVEMELNLTSYERKKILVLHLFFFIITIFFIVLGAKREFKKLAE